MVAGGLTEKVAHDRVRALFLSIFIFVTLSFIYLITYWGCLMKVSVWLHLLQSHLKWKHTPLASPPVDRNSGMKCTLVCGHGPALPSILVMPVG